MSMNYNDFWVRLYPELEYICFGSLSTSSWLPKSKGNSFFNQLGVIKTYQNHNVSLSPEMILSGPNFQNFDLMHQNHLRNFSPLFGFCLWLGLGPRLRGSTPLHFAALNHRDSVVERLLEAKAAVDAQNKKGRGLGGNLMKHGIPLWGREWRCWWFRFFVITTNYILSYTSILFLKKIILRSTFCYRRVPIWGHRLACALQSKKCSWASGVSIVVWTHVTAVFLQVSWFEPKLFFSCHC